MDNDEFFIDDDVIVSLDDNLIEEVIPSIDVIEERLRDDTILRLNQDQINAELTNLIIGRYKNANRLKTKVKNYANLFNQFPKSTSIQFKQIQPVILVDKLKYFWSEDDHIQNKEFEEANFLKSDKLANFLSQFRSIKNAKGEYTQGSGNKLYALYTPFSRTFGREISATEFKPLEDTDAVWHCTLDEFDCSTSQSFRLMSKVAFDKDVVYDGDVVDVIGFYNIVDPDSSEKVIFDCGAYFKALDALQIDDKVWVAFNDPVFNHNAEELIEKVAGKVSNIDGKTITIDLVSSVIYDSIPTKTLLFSTRDMNQGFNVFLHARKEENIFAKPMLSQKNIVFKIANIKGLGNKITVEDLLSFMMPTSVSQYLLLHKDKFQHIFNFSDLTTHILRKGGIDIDLLHKVDKQLISYIFNFGKSSALAVTKPLSRRRLQKQYHYANTSALMDFAKYKDNLKKYQEYANYERLVDDALNRFRYLKSQNDKGAFYFLQRIKANLEKKYKSNIGNLRTYVKELAKLEKDLESLDVISATSDKSCQKQNSVQKFAKEYTSLDVLLSDNDKTVYFDESLDETPYNASEGFKGNNKKELKLFVLNELSSKAKYKNYTKSDLDYEVDSVVSGKRKVRIGDLCVLHTFHGDTVYVRQDVAGKPMWVKKFRTPFKICSSNPLVEYNDLTKLDTCVKETFEEVCKTNQNARILHKYRTLMAMKTELSSLLNLLEKYETIIEQIENDIDYYRHLVDIVPSQHVVERKFEYVDHVDYEEFTGEEYLEDEFQIDFNDQSNFVISPLPKTEASNVEQQSKDKQDVLNMLLAAIELPIDESEFAYILSNVNSKVSRTAMELALKKYQVGLWQQVNETSYKGNEEYRRKVDITIATKMQQKEVELLKKYHYNLLRFMIAMIVIMIFVKYPNYAIKKIIPSCVSFLSYSGYPITNQMDGQRSLVKYFACLISKITDDMRFELYQDKDVKDVEKSIIDAISEILSENYELNTQLEIAKTVFAETLPVSEALSHVSEPITGFKPNYKFANVDSVPQKYRGILKYMKSIHEAIQKSRILKQNIVHVPNLFNSCCTETLTKDLDFFTYFESSPLFQGAKKQVSGMKKEVFDEQNMYPPMKIKGYIDIFSRKLIQHTKTQEVHLKDTTEMEQSISMYKEQVYRFITETPDLFSTNVPDTLLQLVENFDVDNWWYDVFYPRLNKEYDILAEFLTKIYMNTSEINLAYIKDKLILISDTDNAKTIRNTIHMFLKSKLKTLVGSIVNKKTTNDVEFNVDTLKTNPVFAIIASVAANSNYSSISKELQNLLTAFVNIDYLYFDTNDQNLILKNISVLAYMLILFFNQMLQVTTGDTEYFSKSVEAISFDKDIKTKDNFNITSSIINLCLEKLAVQLENNTVDVDSLKMAVERLREQRKEELIAAFRVDDEERMLQNVLKKMGLDNWADVFSNEDNSEVSEEVQATMNPKPIVKDEYEEEKDYIYASYQGENYDNEENEEDYVSYEAYDY